MYIFFFYPTQGHFFLKDFIFKERGREGERQGEKHQCICERNIDPISCLSHASSTLPACPQPETWPANQACALTGNWTGDLFVDRPMLNMLSHTSQGPKDNVAFRKKVEPTLLQPTEPHWPGLYLSFFFKKYFKKFILLLDRGEGREKGRETSMCGCLSCAPWGLGPQPRHVPWLGIEPATLWFTGRHSTHWATPARAGLYLSW